MQCPKCGNFKFKTVKSRILGSGKERILQCWTDEDNKGCGKVVKTFEEIIEVSVYNPNKGHAEWIDTSDYDKEHKNKEQQGQSGFQNRIFN